MTEPEEVTLAKLRKINGVLFPGGDGEYYEFGKYVFEQIKQFNDEGVYYPIWGTCLGFEAISAYSAEAGQDILEEFVVDDESLEIEFVKDPRDTKMFS